MKEDIVLDGNENGRNLVIFSVKREICMDNTHSMPMYIHNSTSSARGAEGMEVN